MIFSRKNVDLTEDIKISNTKIDRIKEANFLGVIVDEKLNRSAHIKSLYYSTDRVFVEVNPTPHGIQYTLWLLVYLFFHKCGIVA